MRDLFRSFAQQAAGVMGSPWAFILAVLFVVVWAASGPALGFSDTWQLIANTVTSIVTFLMVFLIQSTQNRDAKATQLKLDELLRAVHGARTGLVELEHLTDDELDALEDHFRQIRTQAARGRDVRALLSEFEEQARRYQAPGDQRAER